MRIEFWKDGRKAYRADCYFYPEKGIYAGNIYDKDGKAIGDFWGTNSLEIEKRFPGIFV